MKEIKFRQPLFNSNKSFKEWHYWGFIDGTFVSPFLGGNPVTTPQIAYETSQQYTGLKDKLGREIYEADIVNLDSCKGNGHACVEQIGEVKWECACFRARSIPDRDEYVLDNHRHYEVIGNIYENPELLGGKNGQRN